MKLSQSALLVSLLIVSLSFGTAESNSCMTINPFLKILASQSVSLLGQPSTAPAYRQNKCHPEWFPHGTCCEFKSLQEYLKRDLERIDTSLVQTVDSLRSIGQSYQEIQGTSQKLLSSESLQKNKNLKGFLKLLDSFISNTTQSDGIVRYFQDPSFAKASYFKCVNTIKATRARSLCGICSGRSSSFFVGEKAIITCDTCRDILADCRGQLNFLSQYFLKFRHLIKQIRESEFEHLGVNGAIFVLDHIPKSLSELVDQMNKIKFADLVVQYNKDKTTANTIALCEAFVTLVHQTFSESLTALFTKGEQFLNLVSSLFVVLIYRTESAASWTLVGRKRLLQLTHSVDGFIPDVIVLPIGTQFSSQDVSVDPRFFGKQPLRAIEMLGK